MMQCPQGTDISTYNQPVIDTQRQLRNFPGVDDSMYYSIQDMIDGNCTLENEITAPESTAKKTKAK